jgi:hypothetical protein
MREIEKAMCKAFKAGKDWRGKNTAVLVGDDTVGVSLHGNLIAYVKRDDPRILNVSLAGWNTPTTRSRLNALLGSFESKSRFRQKDFGAYLEGEAVGPDDWHRIGLYGPVPCFAEEVVA